MRECKGREISDQAAARMGSGSTCEFAYLLHDAPGARVHRLLWVWGCGEGLQCGALGGRHLLLPDFRSQQKLGMLARRALSALHMLQDALRKEVSLLTSLNHPNLVRFCGVCLDPPLVVMEFYRHGNVFSMLEKARRQWGNCASVAHRTGGAARTGSSKVSVVLCGQRR